MGNDWSTCDASCGIGKASRHRLLSLSNELPVLQRNADLPQQTSVTKNKLSTEIVTSFLAGIMSLAAISLVVRLFRSAPLSDRAQYAEVGSAARDDPMGA